MAERAIREAAPRVVTTEAPAFPLPAPVRRTKQPAAPAPPVLTTSTGYHYCRRRDGQWVDATPVDTPAEFAGRLEPGTVSLEFASSHAFPVQVQRHGVGEWTGEGDPTGTFRRVTQEA